MSEEKLSYEQARDQLVEVVRQLDAATGTGERAAFDARLDGSAEDDSGIDPAVIPPTSE